MAHRANIIQVAESLEFTDLPYKVRDPVCQVEIIRKFSKHVLARESETFYFCSKECMETYMNHQYLPDRK